MLSSHLHPHLELELLRQGLVHCSVCTCFVTCSALGLQENDSAAKGLFVKGMDKVNTNPANKFALDNTISLRDQVLPWPGTYPS